MIDMNMFFDFLIIIFLNHMLKGHLMSSKLMNISNMSNRSKKKHNVLHQSISKLLIIYVHYTKVLEILYSTT
jgi:hypothetical protein